MRTKGRSQPQHGGSAWMQGPAVSSAKAGPPRESAHQWRPVQRRLPAASGMRAASPQSPRALARPPRGAAAGAVRAGAAGARASG
eukprot:scaffold280794_cov27-Tisochrysis_lutea.AAC.1